MQIVQKIFRNLEWLSSSEAPPINQLIRMWQNNRDMMKLCKVLSKRFFKNLFFIIIIIITATVSNTQLGVKTKQFLISSSYKCQNPWHMEEEDKVVIDKCPWCKQNERSVILLCY